MFKLFRLLKIIWRLDKFDEMQESKVGIIQENLDKRITEQLAVFYTYIDELEAKIDAK